MPIISRIPTIYNAGKWICGSNTRMPSTDKKIKNKINNSLQLLKFLAKDTITLLEDECYQPAVSSQAGKI